LTVGALVQNVARTENPTGTYGAADPGNWMITPSTYSAIIGDTGLHQDVRSLLANLNGRVATEWMTHDVWLGTNAYEQIGQTRIGQNYLLGTSISMTDCLHRPDFVNRGAFYKSAYSAKRCWSAATRSPSTNIGNCSPLSAKPG